MNRYSQALTASAILLVSSNIATAGGVSLVDLPDDDDFEPFFEHGFQPFFEIIAMGGIATMDGADTTLQVTPIEYDQQVQTSEGDWNGWTVQLGVGYVYPFIDDLETGEVQWFPLINPQINVYYLDGEDMTGDVWRFEDSDFNQMDFAMDYNSTRLMFDLGVTVAAIEEFSLYAIGGLGIAWNRIDYNATEKPGEDCPISSLSLASNDSTSFAYEFGAGITYAAFDDLAISLEYLYTGFNDVELGNGDLSGYEIEGTDLDINSQAILLGLRYAL